MPVSYEFDDQILVIRQQGQYSVTELEETVLAGLADPARPQGTVLLFDLRESRALRDRPTEDVRGMARFLARHRHAYSSRLVMVAPSDLAFGLMRLGAVTAEAGGVVTEVFRDYEPARAWLLGKGPPAVERIGEGPLGGGSGGGGGETLGASAPRANSDAGSR